MKEYVGPTATQMQQAIVEFANSLGLWIDQSRFTRVSLSELYTAFIAVNQGHLPMDFLRKLFFRIRGQRWWSCQHCGRALAAHERWSQCPWCDQHNG